MRVCAKKRGLLTPVHLLWSKRLIMSTPAAPEVALVLDGVRRTATALTCHTGNEHKLGVLSGPACEPKIATKERKEQEREKNIVATATTTDGNGLPLEYVSCSCHRMLSALYRVSPHASWRTCFAAGSRISGCIDSLGSKIINKKERKACRWYHANLRAPSSQASRQQQHAHTHTEYTHTLSVSL